MHRKVARPFGDYLFFSHHPALAKSKTKEREIIPIDDFNGDAIMLLQRLRDVNAIILSDDDIAALDKTYEKLLPLKSLQEIELQYHKNYENAYRQRYDFCLQAMKYGRPVTSVVFKEEQYDFEEDEDADDEYPSRSATPSTDEDAPDESFLPVLTLDGPDYSQAQEQLQKIELHFKSIGAPNDLMKMLNDVQIEILFLKTRLSTGMEEQRVLQLYEEVRVSFPDIAASIASNKTKALASEEAEQQRHKQIQKLLIKASAHLELFSQQLSRIQVVKNVSVILMGDRGLSDHSNHLCLLLVLQALIDADLRISINFSFGVADLVNDYLSVFRQLARVENSQHRKYQQISFLEAVSIASKNLAIFIHYHLITIDEVAALVEEYYLPNIKLFEIGIGADLQNIALYAHGPRCYFNKVRTFADFFEVAYEDGTVQQLEQTVTGINRRFSQAILENKINLMAEPFKSFLKTKSYKATDGSSDKTDSLAKYIGKMIENVAGKPYSVRYVIGYDRYYSHLPNDFKERVANVNVLFKPQMPAVDASEAKSLHRKNV